MTRFERFIAKFVAVLLVFSSVSTVPSIAADISDHRLILQEEVRGFAGLPDDVLYQTVEFGTKLHELNLPESLTVLVSVPDLNSGFLGMPPVVPGDVDEDDEDEKDDNDTYNNDKDDCSKNDNGYDDNSKDDTDKDNNNDEGSYKDDNAYDEYDKDVYDADNIEEGEQDKAEEPAELETPGLLSFLFPVLNVQAAGLGMDAAELSNQTEALIERTVSYMGIQPAL